MGAADIGGVLSLNATTVGAPIIGWNPQPIQEAFMANALVECIANFSEGRRPDVITGIEKAIRSADPITILDVHSDVDHNRSVISFVGNPEAIKAAAFAGIAKAAELINLDEHEGEHPRIGATDVVPFVPIQGVDMETCIEMARDLGARVAEELGIPVYLYERAANRPDRVNLENIRRGEYEQLKSAIESDPERAPDFGPSRLTSAGATVIGARAPLIAYNIYLTTDDVNVANKIAKAIRHSSGGLRFVKSIGLLVEGRAQVSMNLTDYRRTPIARVTELVRSEAARHGVSIHHAELVGLAPQQSLVEAARWYLQLDEFEPEQILETRLYEAQSTPTSDEFFEQVAEGTPTPGGGAVAAHAAASAAALVGMVARLTIGKKKYADIESRMREIAGIADNLRRELQEATWRDSAAFDMVMEALRLPKSSEEERAARETALVDAIREAAAVPLEVAEKSVNLVAMAAELVTSGNKNAITDAATAGEMANAALRSACLNVLINADSGPEAEAKEWRSAVDRLLGEAKPLQAKLAAALEERASIRLG
jgi:glutamate formiminotransferase/formiminotetrahydrofolate cyclodeaminase